MRYHDITLSELQRQSNHQAHLAHLVPVERTHEEAFQHNNDIRVNEGPRLRSWGSERSSGSASNSVLQQDNKAAKASSGASQRPRKHNQLPPHESTNRPGERYICPPGLPLSQRPAFIAHMGAIMERNRLGQVSLPPGMSLNDLAGLHTQHDSQASQADEAAERVRAAAITQEDEVMDEAADEGMDEDAFLDILKSSGAASEHEQPAASAEGSQPPTDTAVPCSEPAASVEGSQPYTATAVPCPAAEDPPIPPLTS